MIRRQIIKHSNGIREGKLAGDSKVNNIIRILSRGFRGRQNLRKILIYPVAEFHAISIGAETAPRDMMRIKTTSITKFEKGRVKLERS